MEATLIYKAFSPRRPLANCHRMPKYGGWQAQWLDKSLSQIVGEDIIDVGFRIEGAITFSTSGALFTRSAVAWLNSDIGTKL